jgi:hypothetical protein
MKDTHPRYPTTTISARMPLKRPIPLPLDLTYSELMLGIVREWRLGAMRLDTDTGLAPVSSLCVVPIPRLSVCRFVVYKAARIAVQEAYLMVLPVRRRIHWGMGRFCFCALASFILVRKDLWLCAISVFRAIGRAERGAAYRHLDDLCGRQCRKCCRCSEVWLKRRIGHVGGSLASWR